jgi:glutamine cyclotransferase
VYATVTATNKIAVIDAHSLKVVKQIDTHGKLPFWIAVRGND